MRSRIGKALAHPGALIVLGAALLLPLSNRARAADFVRGDANGDGNVTFSDVPVIVGFLFRGTELGCGNAADVNDNGAINLTDAVELFTYLVHESAPPAAPFPDPGVDPTPDEPSLELDTRFPCDAENPNEPIIDPTARLRILDAVVPGGEDRMVSLHVAISSSGNVAGYFGSIHTADILSRDSDDIGFADLSQTFNAGIMSARVHDAANGAQIKFGYVPTIGGEIWIPASEDEEVVLRIDFCVEPGTPAGEYALDLISAELTDFESGRSVVPQLYSGTLTVLEEVTGGACDPERDYGIETNVAIEFELEGGSANPGEEVAVPLTVRTSDRARTHGIQLSVDFDESVLEIVRVDTVHPRPDGQPWNSVLSSLNNDDETPGSAGVDEGYIAGRFIYGSYYGSDILSFPIDAEFTALDLIFRVKENAPVGTTEIRFIDGGIGCFATCEHMVPYRNGMYSAGTSLTPEVVDSFLFINGLLNIVGEVTVFIRGDSNGDHRVDLSDAVFTLGYLFLGKETPGCLDAVDANDDGNLDLSDAVSTLEFLFSGATPLPAPSSSFGVDPTPDSLGCRGSSF